MLCEPGFHDRWTAFRCNRSRENADRYYSPKRSSSARVRVGLRGLAAIKARRSAGWSMSRPNAGEADDRRLDALGAGGGQVGEVAVVAEA